MQQEQQTPPGDVTVAHNAGASRYELSVAGEVAGFAEYRTEGDTVRFTHTEVQPRYEGQGLAKRLARFALEDVQGAGKKANPQCRFIARYIDSHREEFGALVAK